MGLLYVIEDYDETVGIIEEIKYITDNPYARMDLDTFIDF